MWFDVSIMMIYYGKPLFSFGRKAIISWKSLRRPFVPSSNPCRGVSMATSTGDTLTVCWMVMEYEHNNMTWNTQYPLPCSSTLEYPTISTSKEVFNRNHKYQHPGEMTLSPRMLHYGYSWNTKSPWKHIRESLYFVVRRCPSQLLSSTLLKRAFLQLPGVPHIRV